MSFDSKKLQTDTLPSKTRYIKNQHTLKDKLKNHTSSDNNLLLTNATQFSFFPPLQQYIGNQALLRLIRSGRIQPKLKVVESEDVYEKEANRVAERIMRSETSEQPYFQIESGGKRIKSKFKSCREKEDSKKFSISRMENSSRGQVDVTDKTTRNINNIVNQTGSSLDIPTREFMQSRFGYDFGNVRIHTDESAAISATSVNALAYTMGNDVIFGKGHYQPNTFEGKSLLAHELTHVVQQSENYYPTKVADDLKIHAHKRYIIQRKPRGLIQNYKFLGIKVEGGISPKLRNRLVEVEKHLKAQYDTLIDIDLESLADWAGIKSARSWRKGTPPNFKDKSKHQSGSAVDVNYDLQPYIVTRSVSVNKKGKNVTHYGGEGSGRSSPESEEGCRRGLRKSRAIHVELFQYSRCKRSTQRGIDQ